MFVGDRVAERRGPWRGLGVRERHILKVIDMAEELEKQAPQGQEAGAAGQEMQATPSKRDAFRSRVGARYSDLNLDDEDAYYDRMGQMMDEYEGYEKNSQRMRDAVGKSPAMAEMLRAAQQQDDFDPLLWMAENRGLDLDALRDDPEYAQKLADAHAKYMERDAASKKIVEDMAANMPGSVEAITAKAAELGLDEAKTQEIVGQMYQIMEDLVHGKMDVALFEMLAKGASHDADVAQAHEEGQVQGLSTRIDEHLRSGAGREPKPQGRQLARTEAKPQTGGRNPFEHV